MYFTPTGYKEHTDCNKDGLNGKQDRFATVLIYLDDVAVGGHTYFPRSYNSFLQFPLAI